MPTTLSISTESNVATVTLRRPEVHNAFNAAMIAELEEAFRALAGDPNVRVVVIAARGKSFSAGADLNWMREAANYSFEGNLEDARRAARMFRAVAECPKPVIARVQGAALGGGTGLIAACDLAAAEEEARFGFTEVKLGLVPGVISSFVLRKIGVSAARRYFLTGERFSAEEARRIGLIAAVVPGEAELDRQVSAWTRSLLQNGPEAMAATKRLIDEVLPVDWDAAVETGVRHISERRASAEGREGVQAFLEKREPDWRL